MPSTVKKYQIVLLATYISTSIHSFSLRTQTVCYPPFGCFDNAKPWRSPYRKNGTLPESPEEIGTKFYMFKNSSVSSSTEVFTNDTQSLNGLFNPDFETKIVIHGWFSGLRNDECLPVMLDGINLVENKKVNVVYLDWTKGARAGLFGVGYQKSAANTRLVGLQLGHFIEFLCRSFNLKVESFHLIGHSLGAHIAGYTGKYIFQKFYTKIGRISATDPAGPLFQNTPTVMHLTKDDATYVDCIHTDGDELWPIPVTGFGTMQQFGHVDFYPNGGRKQPGCWNGKHPDPNQSGLDCSHNRACFLFADTIVPKVECDTPNYTGFECDSYESFLNGKCDSYFVSQMGYYSNLYVPELKKLGEGYKMFLETGTKQPYCE